MIEADSAGEPHVVTQTGMDGIAKSIWQLTEDVEELWRSRSRAAVHKQKRPDRLWLDEMTETQANTVIAIRQLCEGSPEGVALKTLAERMGVTPAAASVMVDLLVKKKVLKRTKSKNDRRGVLIRLTPETADLFEVSEQSLMQTFMSLQDSFGPEMLRDWHRILMTATTALRQVVGSKTPTESKPSESTPDGDGQST